MGSFFGVSIKRSIIFWGILGSPYSGKLQQFSQVSMCSVYLGTGRSPRHFVKTSQTERDDLALDMP